MTTLQTDVTHHQEALADTGHAYRSFHGWILSCIWCQYQANGRTKGKALELMNTHYAGLGCGKIK